MSRHVWLFVLAGLLTAGCGSTDTVEVFQPNVGEHGTVDEHINDMLADLNHALDQANSATLADTVATVKTYVRGIHNLFWGTSADSTLTALPYPDWKSQWQVSYAEFDPEFANRYGAEPPSFKPADLGILGSGRYVRRVMVAGRGNEVSPTVAALNNLIGWMRIDDGVTKAERQPRIDLTYRWDAPNEFWLSTRDTGWLFEVHAQASNILKTAYDNDLNMAQAHVADLRDLIIKCLDGETVAGVTYPGMRAIARQIRQEGVR